MRVGHDQPARPPDYARAVRAARAVHAHRNLPQPCGDGTDCITDTDARRSSRIHGACRVPFVALSPTTTDTLTGWPPRTTPTAPVLSMFSPASTTCRL